MVRPRPSSALAGTRRSAEEWESLTLWALNERIKLSQSALSQHLAVLREQGLVRTRRSGQTIYYSLSDSSALKVIQLLHDEFCPA